MERDFAATGRDKLWVADITFISTWAWWRALRAYRDGGREALDPPDRRKQRGGPMNTFPPVVRFACLRIKKNTLAGERKSHVPESANTLTFQRKSYQV